MLLFLFTVIPIGIFLLNGVISSAYLPVLFPICMLEIGLWFSSFFSSRIRTTIISIFIFIIISTNIYLLFSSAYFTSASIQSQGFTVFPLQSEEKILHDIQIHSKKKAFSLTTTGFYPNAIQNYVYLAEYMGANYNSKANEVYIIKPGSYTSNDIVIYTSPSIIVTYKHK